MNEFIITMVNGVATGVPLFLIASGLTLIYGVMGVLNFAHGGFFMVGAYLVVLILAHDAVGISSFLLAVGAAAAAVAVIGLVSERGIFSRLYGAGHITNLLASYALLLIINGAVAFSFGPSSRTVESPAVLSGAVRVGDLAQPRYNLFLIAIGIVVATGLWLLLERSSMGCRIRAVAHDRTMARALGIRASRVSVGVFVLGSALAGLAGGLGAPVVSVGPGLDAAFVLQSFAVVIIGGLGSISGALVAAIALGVVDNVLVNYAPGLSGYGVYLTVGVVLLVRPNGLLGRQSESGSEMARL